MHGKLSEQYFIDQCLKVQRHNLRFLRGNQKTLKANNYDVVKAAQKKGIKQKDITVLPSTHPGSPRYLRQKFLDSMEICKEHGKPSLFITMTANPNWAEVKRELSRDVQTARLGGTQLLSPQESGDGFAA